MSHSLIEPGTVAIVTGGGRGIGKAIAQGLAAAGARCVIADINDEGAQAVAAALGNDAISVRTDVSDEQSVSGMVDAALTAFGQVDVLINNAAINMSTSNLSLKPFWDIDLEEWNKVMSINATGAFLCSRHVAPHMKARTSGRIINLTSTAVALGRPNYLHYIASKSAIIGITRSMARELGTYGVAVNAISPGPVETEVPRQAASVDQHNALLAMQCIPEAIRAEDIVGTALFLCSHDSRLITGQVITVDGGFVHN
ncbi:MAG: 3-oxoacyl-ACP reductase family protein [Bauldia litoralis]